MDNVSHQPGFTDIFIKKPVFASVISLLILIVGVFAYFKMPLRQFPAIDASVINVSTSYSGAAPSLMESFVTTPIESALSGIAGLNYMSSTSKQGGSNVTLYFDLGYSMDAAMSDVISKMSSVRKTLPDQVQDPVVTKQDPNSLPVIQLAFSSTTMSGPAITDYLSRTIVPVLQSITGVSQAKIYGSDYAMRITLDPLLLGAESITASDVKNAITANNVQSAAGQVMNPSEVYSTSVDSTLSTAKEFNNVVVKQSRSHLVRLKNVGKAVLSTAIPSILGFFEGKQTTYAGLIATSNANPLLIADGLEKVLGTIKTELPGDLTAKVVRDTTQFIRSSLKEVSRTLIEATIFVIIVIFVFLGSFRTLFVPVVTIPLSLFGVCAFMFALGFSINTMTLLAMVLAIGMVVDDAIVVAENIHRHIEMGKSPFKAALIGAREIRFAVIAMTLTLAAVYAPIAFVGGITGSLFKEFSFTLAGAVIISGFIALTLSPMICSKLFKTHAQDSKLQTWVDTSFNKISNAYESLVKGVLKARWLVGLFILAVLSVIVLIVLSMPQELAPKEDSGFVLALGTGPAQSSLDYTARFTKKVTEIFKTVPEGVQIGSILGIPNGLNSSLAFLQLKPWSQRKRTASEIVKSLFPTVHNIAGMQVFPVNPYRLPGSGGLMSVNFVLKTTNTYTYLNTYAQKLLAAAKASKLFKNLSVNLTMNQPGLNVTINRRLASVLGVSISDITDALSTALSGAQFSQFEMNGRSYDVIALMQDEFRDTPDALKLLNVKTRSGQLVPLSSLVTVDTTVGPQTLAHFQQLRAATLSGVPAPGKTLGAALAELQTLSAKLLPHDISIDYSGESRQYVDSGTALQQAVIFALIFIFLVLSAQFESYRDACIVLFSVPLSVVGALLFLKFGGGSLNIYTWVGLMTLVGLITKHGILIVDVANRLQLEGQDKFKAVIAAAKIRLRPILMTTAAMLLGVLPLVFASGAGSVSRHQMGLVIFGGMLIGTCFTLFVIPVVYTWLATKKEVYNDAA